MTEHSDHAPETIAVHAGVHKGEYRPVTPPIYQTSTFAFDSAEEGAALFAGLIFFLQTYHGVIRVEVTPPKHKTTLGSHPLTIVDTSGKPYGGTSGTHQDDTAGITTHFFESANGRYKITLENEIMTINGDKYMLENSNDSIRIVDDRLEINGVETAPDTE